MKKYSSRQIRKKIVREDTGIVCATRTNFWRRGKRLGPPDYPQCGFSANAVAILNYFNIEFKSYNVLENDELRQGIKQFSDWPTIPQIYIKQEFIGGFDILKDMAESGDFEQFLKENQINFAAQSLQMLLELRLC